MSSNINMFVAELIGILVPGNDVMSAIISLFLEVCSYGIFIFWMIVVLLCYIVDRSTRCGTVRNSANKMQNMSNASKRTGLACSSWLGVGQWMVLLVFVLCFITSLSTVYAYEMTQAEMDLVFRKIWWSKNEMPIGVLLTDVQTTFAGLCQKQFVMDCRKAVLDFAKSGDTSVFIDLYVPLGVELPNGTIDWNTESSSDVSGIAAEDLIGFDIGHGYRGFSVRRRVSLAFILNKIK